MMSWTLKSRNPLTKRCLGDHSIPFRDTQPCNATPGRKPSAFNFRTKAKGLMHLMPWSTRAKKKTRFFLFCSASRYGRFTQVKSDMCFFVFRQLELYNITYNYRCIFICDGFIIHVLQRTSGAKIHSVHFLSILEALKEGA